MIDIFANQYTSTCYLYLLNISNLHKKFALFSAVVKDRLQKFV